MCVHAHSHGDVGPQLLVEPNLPAIASGSRLKAARDCDRDRELIIDPQQLGDRVTRDTPPCLLDASDYRRNNVRVYQPESSVYLKIAVIAIGREAD